jgi:hypothetical protein
MKVVAHTQFLLLTFITLSKCEHVTTCLKMSPLHYLSEKKQKPAVFHILFACLVYCCMIHSVIMLIYYEHAYFFMTIVTFCLAVCYRYNLNWCRNVVEVCRFVGVHSGRSMWDLWWTKWHWGSSSCTTCCWGYKIKDDEVGGACSTRLGDGRLMQNFTCKKRREDITSEVRRRR